jgi:hypothetical protein
MSLEMNNVPEIARRLNVRVIVSGSGPLRTHLFVITSKPSEGTTIGLWGMDTAVQVYNSWHASHCRDGCRDCVICRKNVLVWEMIFPLYVQWNTLPSNDGGARKGGIVC